MIVFTLTDMTTFLFGTVYVTLADCGRQVWRHGSIAHVTQVGEEEEKKNLFLATAAAFQWNEKWYRAGESLLRLHWTEEAQHRKLPPAILRIKSPIPPGSPLPLLATSWGKGRDRGGWKTKTMTKTQGLTDSLCFCFPLPPSCVQHRSGSEMCHRAKWRE